MTTNSDSKRPGSGFGDYMRECMKRANMSLRDVAQGSDFQYLAFEKLLSGMTTPSDEMLEYLSSKIGMDVEVGRAYATLDRAHRPAPMGTVQ